MPLRLQNIIIHYVNELCLNIRLNINLHKPDADEIWVWAYVNKTVNRFTLL